MYRPRSGTVTGRITVTQGLYLQKSLLFSTYIRKRIYIFDINYYSLETRERESTSLVGLGVGRRGVGPRPCVAFDSHKN